MQKEKLKLKIFEKLEILNYGKVKIAKINQKVYQKGKGEDSQRGFGFERTGKVDQGTLSKIFKAI